MLLSGAFPGIILRSQVQLPEPVEKTSFSLRVKKQGLRSSENFLLWVKNLEAALPEITETHVFLWWCGGRRAGWRRGGRQRWNDYVRGFSEQCVLRCDQTRSKDDRRPELVPTQHQPTTRKRVRQETVKSVDLLDAQQ